MKVVKIDFGARLALTYLVGGQKGTVADIVVLSALMKKLNPPAEERTEAGLEEKEGGILNWNPAYHLLRPIRLEDAEVQKLRSVIKGHQNFTPADAEWVSDALKALEGGK
jgi:hypothetical protein